MTRHEARINVFSMIFAAFFRKDEDVSAIYETEAEERQVGGNAYVRTTFFGVCEKAKELDKTINAAAENWRIGRMSNTAKAILRLAVYELLDTDVPPKVAINEAVEIAKEYADENEASFVNGILNRIAKENGVFEAVETTEEPVSSPDEE